MRSGAPENAAWRDCFPPFSASLFKTTEPKKVEYWEVLSPNEFYPTAIDKGVVFCDSSNFVVVGGRRWKEREHVSHRHPGPLYYVPFKDEVDPMAVTVIPKLFIPYPALMELREAFSTLRMVFPVRCRHGSCAMDGRSHLAQEEGVQPGEPEAA